MQRRIGNFDARTNDKKCFMASANLVLKITTLLITSIDKAQPSREIRRQRGNH